MAQNKTTETEKSVTEFINNITDDTKRNDCFELIKIIKKLQQYLFVSGNSSSANNYLIVVALSLIIVANTLLLTKYFR